MKRCLALARDPSWHELARSGMGLAQPQRYALLQAEAVYVSSPREDTIRLDTLMKLHPDRDFIHLPVTHAFVDRLFDMYAGYVRQRRERLDRPGGVSFYPRDLVLVGQLVARQDDSYYYVSKEYLLRVQQALSQGLAGASASAPAPMPAPAPASAPAPEPVASVVLVPASSPAIPVEASVSSSPASSSASAPAVNVEPAAAAAPAPAVVSVAV